MTRAAGIWASGVCKSFGDLVVLHGIDLDVAAGTVFALLGPNGAGKTTAVHILATLLAPDAGEIRIAGFDPATDADAVRRSIGLTGQFSAVDNLLTGEENLILMADLRHLGRRDGRRRAAELLARFDLVDAARRPAATYSGGMRRRLDLAMTLVGEPRVIFLDEPTTGLDPRSRRGMWAIIRSLVADGVTVFLTTQYLDEADHLADRIAVLDAGRLVAEGTSDELKRLVPGGHVRLRLPDAVALESAARALDGAALDHQALTLQIPSDGGVRAPALGPRPARGPQDRGRRALGPHTRSRRRVPGAHRSGGQPERRCAMSAMPYVVTDSATMLRRNLRHALRYPSMTVSTVLTPVLFLLLFNYVLGPTLGAGIGATDGDATRYVDYLAPGILVMAAASAAVSTAVGVSVDMTEGIVDRFRAMAVSGASLLTGHVVGSMIRTLLASAVVVAVGVAIGFRPTSDPARWAAALGLFALLALSLTWIAVALGLLADTPETASNLPLPLALLPLIGSGFVPTDSMPAGLRQFAEYQPFTPIIDTVRALLLGGPLGGTAALAVAWCMAMTAGGFLAARMAYERRAGR